jgi:hypothetical protein
MSKRTNAYLFNANVFQSAELLRCFGGAQTRHAGRIRVPKVKPGAQLWMVHYATGPRILKRLTDKVLADMTAGLASRAHTMNYDGVCYMPPAQ